MNLRECLLSSASLIAIAAVPTVIWQMNKVVAFKKLELN
jgi:hypothetical protein